MARARRRGGESGDKSAHHEHGGPEHEPQETPAQHEPPPVRTFEHRGHEVTIREQRGLMHGHELEHGHPQLVIDGEEIQVMFHEDMGGLFTPLMPWKTYEDLESIARDIIAMREVSSGRASPEDAEWA